MADARGERTDLNVLRGLAGFYMVIHHVWARYPVAVSGLGKALVELGSCAPVLFFFATGAGYGLKGGQRGPLSASTAKKVGVLLLADQLINLWQDRALGLDFLGFIAVSMLLLEWIARRDRPVAVASALGFAVIAARYVLGTQAVLGRLGLQGESAVWLQAAVGATGMTGVSYPPCPWLVYPLLGFAAARTVPALGPQRALIGLGAVVAGSAALTLALAHHGLVFFRWGTVSAAFFVLSFAALSGSFAAALVIARVPSLASALSMRGVAAFVLVPLHYFCVELAATFERPPKDGVELALFGAPVVAVAFAGSKRAAPAIQRIAGSRALYLGACVTAALCGWLLVPGRGVPLPPFWAVACTGAGQLALCALLVWRWQPRTAGAPGATAPS